MRRGGVWRRALAALALACAATGCARRLDLASARDPGQAVITIAYDAVHDETRLYPDYGHIGASILTDDARPPPRKKGKSP